MNLVQLKQNHYFNSKQLIGTLYNYQKCISRKRPLKKNSRYSFVFFVPFLSSNNSPRKRSIKRLVDKVKHPDLVNRPFWLSFACQVFNLLFTQNMEMWPILELNNYKSTKYNNWVKKQVYPYLCVSHRNHPYLSNRSPIDFPMAKPRSLSAYLLIFFALSAGIMLSTLSSCSGYEQLLKSENLDLKYERAREYYNKGSYAKALPLFKQLQTLYKGTEREEELLYFICYSHYGQGDYLLASALFKNYYTFFPTTERSSKANYMSAYSLGLASPKYSLDQTVSYKAIDAYQIFVNRYPTSDSVAAANQEIDKIRRKLEQKAVESADLYYKTRNFRAASVAYSNLLINYPDIPNGDYYQYLVLKSQSEFADQSVVCKQEDRYGKSITAFNRLRDRYSESIYLKDATTLFNRASEKKAEAIEGCLNQERLTDLLLAETARRNKRNPQAISMYSNYLRKNKGHSSTEEVLYNLTLTKYNLAKETESDSEDPCEAVPLYENAMQSYFSYTEEFKEGKLLDQAEKLYGKILNSQDRSQKACNEHN
ncbi:MAG: outer membrane protein assembly factor BamD [Limisphaerales bacterium]